MYLSRQNVGSHLLFAINKQNNRHTTTPQTHISFIMSCPKGVGSRHKSETGNNQGRQWTTPCDNRCFNLKYIHSKINELSSPVISVPLPFHNSFINPPQLSSVCQRSSRSSQNTPCDNRCFNRNYSNLKRIIFNHRWYLNLLHWIIRSLIDLRSPRFVNSHPDLHRTLLMIIGALIPRTVN